MIADLKAHVIERLPRNLLIDIVDTLTAQSAQAFQMVRDHAKLDAKREKELIGQARFRMMEQGFVDACLMHGGLPLPDGQLPGTELRAFQPFMRFGDHDNGVILGLASMPAPREIPHKNRSREAGVMLNAFLTPSLDLGDVSVKAGDVFVLFLAARDRRNPGLLAEVALGVVDSDYAAYLMYEPINRFLAGYAPASPPDAPVTPLSEQSLVKLKSRPAAFRPPESTTDDREDESGS